MIYIYIRETIYTLPELEFVGGASVSHFFNCFKTKRPLDLEGAKVNLSIVNYTNKTGAPLISKQFEILQNRDGVYNVIPFKLEPEETVDLSDKNVYQFTVIDKYGRISIPDQGIIFITKNIHPDVIRS